METYDLSTYTSISGLYPVPEDENRYFDFDEYVPYPEDIVKAWFATANVGEDDLERWLHETYMLSDTEDLFAYAKEHGCKWERNFILCGNHLTLTEMKEEFKHDMGIHPDESNVAADSFWKWINDLIDCRVLTEDKITVAYTPVKEKKSSKNSIPLLTEAVIEIIDVIDYEFKAFRESFEDSRDFNYMISQWAEEYLDWWDKEEEAGTDHSYLDEIWNFVEKKARAEATHTYRVWYTMSGYAEVKACSEEEAKLLAGGAEMTWDYDNVDLTDVTKED